LNYSGTIRRIADERPIDALIAAYAARTLSAPFAAMVSAHLELRPENRAYAATLEAVHGVFLEELRPVPLAGRDRRLVNIFAAPPIELPRARPASSKTAVLPRALRRLAGCDLDELEWRPRTAGIKAAALAAPEGGQALFASVRPGKRLPLPNAEGLAAALLLDGTVRNVDGAHGRGAIVFADAVADAPLVDGERDCVCFIVTDAPVRLRGALSRVFGRVIGS
jgi:putative transcriptional regulator